jgi:GTPase SAR1 family protein
VTTVGWSPDGSYVVSGGTDGTVRLWNAAIGTHLAILNSHKAGVNSVGWSPDRRVWAADLFGMLFSWQLDPGTLPSDAADPDASRLYTNAKVLVVGESGAGKPGLTHRLATGYFQPSDSTIGAWCTHLPLPQPASPVADQPQREVWLWDFGGQADQRLIHQLFLDRAALVLLLFDAARDEVLEGLHEWQTALRRSLPDPPPQLLVAARVDTGFRASRALLESFAKEENMTLLETSARDGSGCETLQQAIHDAIDWGKLPCHNSPRLFQEIKEEILRLRDQGKALLTLKDLREFLRLRVHTPGFDDASLHTVLGLLDGPGVLKQLDYGTYVLLKPEWLGVYGQAVLRRLRKAEPQLGALQVGAIAAADLPFADDQPRLEPAEEQALLAELERQLQDRKICLRQGGQLVFPSHCGRERSPSPALPPRFVSYAVRGWLDELYATLVASLAETGVFCLEKYWRDGAEFRTLATVKSTVIQALAVQLRRDNAREGLVTLHVGPEVADAERVQFALFIDNHLRATAETVARRRHWICPHCKAPKGNEEVLMKKLARAGERANVMCDDCDRRFPLYDNLERLFTDTSLRRQAEALGELELPELTARRKGKLLLLEVGARITSANQKWQEITPDEDDGLDLQLEFTDDDGNGTGAYLYLQLKAGPSHLHRRADGRDIFSIKKPRWVCTWTQQPFPVMLVIGRPAGPEGWDFDGESLADDGFDDGWPARKRVLGPASLRRWNENNRERFPSPRTDHRAFPDVRWMEISSLLKRELAAGRSPEDIRHIDFEGEPLDLASVLRWRRKILDGRPL